MKNCTDCILDSTDACPRGAGRAVDNSICSDFLEDKERKTVNKVLDKIRAEIEELQKAYQEYGWAYDDAIKIIDKYKAENEG